LDGSSSKEDTGTYLHTALKSIKQYSLCDENLWKYDISKFSELPPITSFCDTYFLKNYIYNTVPQDISYITNSISHGHPILIGIYIYTSFESKEVDSTGIIPIPDTKTEILLGGHCLIIVGYDNNSKYFKVQNSWGTNWGASGYCFIPYDYILDSNLTLELFTVSFEI
jgi:C1A family cysteine protease